MFTYFTDRDGKYQLKCMAESGFDPLARTCRFMLTEEAHHMFVGDTGIGRVVKRTLEVMNELKTDNPAALRAAGVVDLPTIQKYINFWFSSSLDLFGAENSSNAASTFANGIKGRPDEGSFADHLEKDSSFKLDTPNGEEDVPMRNAMNEVVRGGYVKDCETGFKRWNRMIERAGWQFELRLPSTRFRRGIGAWAGVPVDPQGNRVSLDVFTAHQSQWLPTAEDKTFVKSLMQGVVEPGKMAGWVAAPDRGINNNPVEYEYVKLQ
jgi:benzoyl-CoA 2,3-dioxygenase component B